MLKIWFLNAPGLIKRYEIFTVSFWRFRLILPFVTKNTFEEILIDDELIERKSGTETFWFPIGLKKIQFNLCVENDIKMNIKIRVGYYD